MDDDDDGGGGKGEKRADGERWGGRRRRERDLWEMQPVGEREEEGERGGGGGGVLHAAQESYKSLTLMRTEGGRPALFPPSASTPLFFHKAAVFIPFFFPFPHLQWKENEASDWRRSRREGVTFSSTGSTLRICDFHSPSYRSPCLSAGSCVRRPALAPASPYKEWLLGRVDLGGGGGRGEQCCSSV